MGIQSLQNHNKVRRQVDFLWTKSEITSKLVVFCYTMFLLLLVVALFYWLSVSAVTTRNTHWKEQCKEGTLKWLTLHVRTTRSFSLTPVYHVIAQSFLQQVFFVLFCKLDINFPKYPFHSYTWVLVDACRDYL